MTAQEEQVLFRTRWEHIAYFAERTEMYKACDQCRSLVLRSHPACPFCAAYRFSEDVKYIHATLKEMAEVPMPVSSAVAPRIQTEADAETDWSAVFTPRVRFW